MTEAEKRKYRVCFTGHRPEKLTRHECQVIKDLEAAIKKAIADGHNVFISGMAPGVDIWAAEIVLHLRDEGADIKLICAIPFEGFEKRWPEWEGRYGCVEEFLYNTQGRHSLHLPGCAFRRNSVSLFCDKRYCG